MYAFAGETARALGWLEKAYDIRPSRLVYLNVFWEFDALRGEARFQDLLRRLNFSSAIVTSSPAVQA